MNFFVSGKGLTARGSNYFDVDVEIANGIWIKSTYFGNTVPKSISSVKPSGDRWIAEIQKHTSRDKHTGQFKGKRK